MANLVKNLFRDVVLEGNDEERKFALHNLHLHSKPCVDHIVDMVRTIASQDELAVFQSNSGLDRQEPTDRVLSKQTERRLVFYNREMDGLFRTTNNWVYEALKVNPGRNVNKTIQAA